MCSVGGPPDIDLDLGEVKYEKYKCQECGETFKGAGKHPTCTSCGSEKVERS